MTLGFTAVMALVLFVLGAWLVTGISYVLGVVMLLFNIPALIEALINFFPAFFG